MISKMAAILLIHLGLFSQAARLFQTEVNVSNGLGEQNTRLWQGFKMAKHPRCSSLTILPFIEYLDNPFLCHSLRV